ncbi:DUF1772 domain-containing protein [Fodinicola acaciae]|uniref:DUF1772 domain-containing protein n=1 Tax=Fodinicola acaciae TaxID=2681555 RepID=UPI0013D703F4|nr:DUF1772 domain-containing protein [Fodinicola acaciae]
MWRTLGKLGQAAWLCGNVYEAAAGVPELLVAARERRSPGLLAVGSPLRYFAPIAPFAIGATSVALARKWRTGNKTAIVASAASTAAAVGMTGYLVRTVNVPMLKGESTSDEAVARWHRINYARIGATALAAITFHWATK